MSDPLKSVDIEDVLTSIRRLVSDESRARSPAAPPVSDRLVLTPALRVTPAEPDIACEPADLSGTRAGSADYGMPQDEVSVSGADDKTPPAALAPAGPAAVELAPGREQIEELSDAAGAVRQAETDAQLQNVAVDADAAISAAQQQTAPAHLPDAGDPTAAQDGSAAAEDVMIHAPAVSGPPASEQPAPLVSSEPPLTLDAWSMTDSGADVAGQSADDLLDWEDHLAPQEGVTIPPDAGTDQPAPPPHEPDPAREDEAFDTSPQDRVDLTADDTLLDEEALRELVAEIVRQELQGALGERITRNVRKLVRREIHRALSSQDFE